MDFSKKYLLKYGWEEGEGLGKTRSGIKNAIKPKLKFDKAGMGYDPSIEFTDSWWIKVYNDALDSTSVTKEKTKKNKSDDYEHQEKPNNAKRKLSEDPFAEMFKACEGRTVHKGARQGLRLSGKLQRLEQQEIQTLPETTKVKKEKHKKMKEPILEEEQVHEEEPMKVKRHKKQSSTKR